MVDRGEEGSVYMLEGPCSGNIRHMILSKRALARVEVLTMDQALLLLSHEWRPYFAEYGPVLLKSDKRPQWSPGKTGAAALTWEEVIARVDPIRFGSTS